MTSVLRKQIFSVLILAAATMFLIPVSARAESVATIEQVQGEVSVHSVNAAADLWTPIAQNTSLNNGDSVKTKNGSCVLVYADQATFSLDANTSITVKDQTDTKDILLDLGKLRAKVNHEKVIKPFQVVTPTAVGAVRGTDVTFDFNDQGQLTIQLENGNMLVYNDEAEMKVDLGGKKTIIVQYDAEAGILRIQNDCSSDGKVVFNVQGTEYAENPCDKKEINLETAAGGNNPPGTPGGDKPETPDTHNDDNPPPPTSPTTPEEEPTP